MLRHGCLAEIQHVLDLANAFLPVNQQAKNGKTRLVRQCLQEIARLTRVSSIAAVSSGCLVRARLASLTLVEVRILIITSSCVASS